MTRRRLLWWGIGLSVAAAVLGTVIGIGYTEPPAFDAWWNSFVSMHRDDVMLDFALVLNTIGGGWVAILLVPLLVIAALLLARRWRAAVFAALCFLASAGAVQVLKHLVGRARPDDMVVASDFGSFPSGHTANAATIAVVVWVLFPRVWTAIAGAVWILAMALSRTFLSVHWVTDTLGGALLGAAVVLLLASWLLPWIRSRQVGAPEPAHAS